MRRSERLDTMSRQMRFAFHGILISLQSVADEHFRIFIKPVSRGPYHVYIKGKHQTACNYRQWECETDNDTDRDKVISIEADYFVNFISNVAIGRRTSSRQCASSRLNETSDILTRARLVSINFAATRTTFSQLRYRKRRVHWSHRSPTRAREIIIDKICKLIACDIPNVVIVANNTISVHYHLINFDICLTWSYTPLCWSYALRTKCRVGDGAAINKRPNVCRFIQYA